MSSGKKPSTTTNGINNFFSSFETFPEDKTSQVQSLLTSLTYLHGSQCKFRGSSPMCPDISMYLSITTRYTWYKWTNTWVKNYLSYQSQGQETLLQWPNHHAFPLKHKNANVKEFHFQSSTKRFSVSVKKHTVIPCTVNMQFWSLKRYFKFTVNHVEIPMRVLQMEYLMNISFWPQIPS